MIPFGPKTIYLYGVGRDIENKKRADLACIKKRRITIAFPKTEAVGIRGLSSQNNAVKHAKSKMTVTAKAGLSVSKRIADTHDGSLELVKSDKDGSVLRLRFPDAGL